MENLCASDLLAFLSCVVITRFFSHLPPRFLLQGARPYGALYVDRVPFPNGGADPGADTAAEEEDEEEDEEEEEEEDEAEEEEV